MPRLQRNIKLLGTGENFETTEKVSSIQRKQISKKKKKSLCGSFKLKTEENTSEVQGEVVKSLQYCKP